MVGLFTVPPAYAPRAPQPLGTCVWAGRTFNIWPLSQALSDFPGVYIFTRLINNVHYAVYVGQSDQVGRRIREHQRDEPHIASGSYHLHCSTVSEGEWMRLLIERSLIGSFNPPLNVTHRTGAAAIEIAPIVPDRWNPILSGLFTQ